MEPCAQRCVSCHQPQPNMFRLASHSACSLSCVWQALSNLSILTCPSCNGLVQYARIHHLFSQPGNLCPQCRDRPCWPGISLCHRCSQTCCQNCGQAAGNQQAACTHLVCEQCAKTGCPLCQSSKQHLCMICLEPAPVPAMLECGHVFCPEDFRRFARHRIKAHDFNLRCPDCSSEISMEVTQKHLTRADLDELSLAAAKVGLGEGEKSM